MKPIHLKSRDRRTAAIHEAGHIVIARKLGLPVYSARIVPHDDGGRNEKFWTGWVRLGPYRTKPTKCQRRMVGVAGAIAELSWQRELDDIDDFDWCQDWWDDPAIMSESDWDLAGCAPGEPDKPFFTAINKVGALLRRNTGPLWPQLIRAARLLIVESRPSSSGPSVFAYRYEIAKDVGAQSEVAA